MEAEQMPVQTTYPGVYIEERPSGVHAIAGVSTSVTAFVGAAAQGVADKPIRIFSVADFVRTFGSSIDEDHPLGYAVAHFFANGGSQAVIVRVLGAGAAPATITLQSAEGTPKNVLVLTASGKGAWANRVAGKGLEVSIDRAGSANPNDLFNLVLTSWSIDPRTNASVVAAREEFRNLSMSPSHPRSVLNAAGASALVIPALASPAPTTTAKGTSVGAGAVANPLTITEGNNRLRVSVDWGAPVDVVLFPTDVANGGSASKTPAEIADEMKNNGLPNAGLNATASESGGVLTIQSSTGGMDSAVTVTPAATGDASKDLKLGLAWGGTEVSGSADKRPAETAAPAPFAGGSDGSPVTPADFVPSGGSGAMYALDELLFPRFNLLCLPGVTSDNDVQVSNALSYCREQRAFLIVDSPAAGFTAIPPNLGSIQALGEHGAIYFPRVRQVEALAGGASRTLNLPASGAVAGVMARIDASRGVWKAPAGMEAGIAGISGLTQATSDDVSGQLNPKGVNALRTFPGSGTVVWGARTLKGDDAASSEFKYVPVRRLTDYIASSLYLGTQFAVFEGNDEDLWSQLRLAVGAFMRGLFRQGAFQQSAKRAESDSFFVICDETVNPQSEIDLGRVNVVVGFAPLKPAEFVVITITQISQLEE
jgi:phage tail sheath protein FI